MRARWISRPNARPRLRQGDELPLAPSDYKPASSSVNADRLHRLIPRARISARTSHPWRGSVERAFDQLMPDWALVGARDVPSSWRSFPSDGHRTARGAGREPAAATAPATLRALQIARFILFVLAVIGVIAIALLVLGLLKVHIVTDHFRIH